jgi:small nuclear ribonucleoprotein
MDANLPSHFGRFVGQKVELELKDGRKVRGRLVGTDEHMNVVLEDAEEEGPAMVRRLGTLIVRGSNVASLNAPAGPRP